MRRRAPWLVFGAFALVALAGWGALALADATRRSVLATVSDEADAALALQAKTLEGVLEKYRHLPAMLADRGDVRALFAPAPPEWSETAGEAIARDIAGVSGAADVGFLGPDGAILAASGDVLRASADALPRLVEAPRQGRLGRTLLRADGEPFYAFSYPVRREGFAGAVVVVAGLDRIAETWSLALYPIRATAPDGRLIVGNDRTLAGGTGIERSRFLPQTRWRLTVHRSDEPAHRAWRDSLVRSGLLLLVALLCAAALAWRWRRNRRVLRREQAQALRLERRVRDRTRDLAAANDALRAAQDELVRSAKLAALGRMSASLAHEVNQPLAAMRTYADNAARLLERGRAVEAGEAVARITACAERMSRLSRTLRSFARTPGHEVRAVSLDAALADARLLLEPRAQERGVRIAWPAPDPSAVVEGGELRLSQILVNVIGNAVEAAREAVTVEVDLSDPAISRVTVRDDGEGVDAGIADQIFDPFFTTRPVGQGLGLGLSIAYNIARDFGGELRLQPSRSGAVFALSLKRASSTPPLAPTSLAEDEHA